MWWWRKVRRANISKELRDHLERFGETVITHALVITYDKGPEGVVFLTQSFGFMHSTILYKLVTEHRDDALAWLTERRDVAERKEQRVETVEVAILIFVVFGVVLDFMLLLSRR